MKREYEEPLFIILATFVIVGLFAYLQVYSSPEAPTQVAQTASFSNTSAIAPSPSGTLLPPPPPPPIAPDTTQTNTTQTSRTNTDTTTVTGATNVTPVPLSVPTDIQPTNTTIAPAPAPTSIQTPTPTTDATNPSTAPTPTPSSIPTRKEPAAAANEGVVVEETSSSTNLIEGQMELVEQHIADADSTQRVRTVLEERLIQVDLVKSDSDGDGVSDYDEIAIYNTDPFNANTAGSSMNDGERILLGLDPLTNSAQPMTYIDDPRDTGSGNRILDSETFNVDELLVEEDERVFMQGTAMPNSFVTVFIYSSPIVVVTKADERGVWMHTLDQDISDGQHEMYVASVNSTGKILSQSPRIPFTKEARAIELNAEFEPAKQSDMVRGFFTQHFTLLVLLIAGAALLGTIAAIWLHRKDPDEETSPVPTDTSQNV